MHIGRIINQTVMHHCTQRGGCGSFTYTPLRWKHVPMLQNMETLIVNRTKIYTIFGLLMILVKIIHVTSRLY